MKITFKIIALLAFVLLLNSCGINYAMVDHQNQNATEVQLTSNNFKVLGKVSGTAEVEYVLFFGGRQKTQLYTEAYSKMLEAAQLEGTSKAVVNVFLEEHSGGVPPFYTKRTLTLSAYVVEFTGK